MSRTPLPHAVVQQVHSSRHKQLLPAAGLSRNLGRAHMGSCTSLCTSQPLPRTCCQVLCWQPPTTHAAAGRNEGTSPSS